jgi:hypothetical protein
MQTAAVTLSAGPVEHGFALRLELAQRRIGIRKRADAGDRICKLLHRRRRKERLLKSREIIEEALGWLRRHLRMRNEGAPSLLLQRAKPPIMLVSTLPVWSERILSENRCPHVRRPDRIHRVGASDRDVGYRHDGAPQIDERLVRRTTCRRIDHLDVVRKRHRDPNEPVLDQVRVVARVVAVDAEVVGVDRPEERIVGSLAVRESIVQRIEPCLRRRR